MAAHDFISSAEGDLRGRSWQLRNGGEKKKRPEVLVLCHLFVMFVPFPCFTWHPQLVRGWGTLISKMNGHSIALGCA